MGTLDRGVETARRQLEVRVAARELLAMRREKKSEASARHAGVSVSGMDQGSQKRRREGKETTKRNTLKGLERRQGRLIFNQQERRNAENGSGPSSFLLTRIRPEKRLK